MKKRNQKQEKRVKKLILSTGLFAVLLVASTYAWFIGMKSVSVTTFDIKIKATEGLALSVSGDPNGFSDKITINKTNFNKAYEGNQNVWGDLIPMSSVGVVNPETSKLELYEKGSLTASKGGYRILASQVENTAAKEADGYVAFDLFIKNLSGEEYYTANKPANEEAIYLTTDSAVTVASAGADASKGDEAGVAGTGIENSVRVAFAQIARVEANTTDASLIEKMSCKSSDSSVTTICNQRRAQIWEPNDKAHHANAINWYNKACLARTGDDVTKKESYGSYCASINDETQYYPTYAIATVIDDNNTNVDIYDGAAYNGYTKSGKFLNQVDYFTDTEKNLKGMQRPEFMTLAPNSITKVRVYVWIEGQDVDNYDFAQLGSAITVNFGFTKERFTDEDVSYSESGSATLPDDVKVKKN